MELFDKIAKELSFKETKELLVDLANHFSEETKLVPVPVGTTFWYYFQQPKIIDSKIIIPLIPFFGMYVGYNSELDILVMWKF